MPASIYADLPDLLMTAPYAVAPDELHEPEDWPNATALPIISGPHSLPHDAPNVRLLAEGYYWQGYFTNGCRVAPDCFTCPLDDCTWTVQHAEEPTARQLREEYLTQEISRCLAAELPREDSLALLGINKRTYYRLLPAAIIAARAA